VLHGVDHVLGFFVYNRISDLLELAAIEMLIFLQPNGVFHEGDSILLIEVIALDFR